MKNSELLAADATGHPILYGLDKQRVFILKMALLPMTCPSCGKPCSQVESYGTGDLDSYPIGGNSPADKEFTCPNCQTQLHYCVPLFGSTFWMTERAWQGSEADREARAAARGATKEVK